MASPTPEAAAAPAAPVEDKPVDGALKEGTEAKPESNGPEPSADNPTDSKPSADEPLVNGNGKVEATPDTNGVSKEDGAANTEEAPLKTEVTAAEPEKKADTAPAAKGEEEPTSDAVPAADSEAKPTSPQDVEMSEPKSETAEKPASPEPATQSADTAMKDPPNDAPNPTPNDVAQADVKKVEVVPAADAEEKKEPAQTPTEPASSMDDTALPASEVDLGPSGISQLAIEASEGNTSPVEPSVEVSMTDAPPAKVAREREEDATDEPAPKRAKTEPKEDEDPAAAVAETSTPGAATPAPMFDTPATPNPEVGKTFDDLPRFNDGTFLDQTLQQFQARELRRSMARVKKTKDGGPFKESVERLWPGIWENYTIQVKKPMDLSTIDRGLRDGHYKTFGQFRRDLLLILENCLTFNGAEHPMTLQSKALIRSVWSDVMKIPAEEPVKAKPPPKFNRPREPRHVPAKPEDSGSASKEHSGGGSASAASAPARRESAVGDANRPKRAIKPPKSKEIEYTSTASRKALKPELQFCDEVLSDLMGKKNHTVNVWFMEPVDAEGLGLPHYRSLIKHPMDFGTISEHLRSGKINSVKDFEKNVRLVFKNAYDFNGPPQGDPQTNAVPYAAKQLEDSFNSQMKGKDKWMSKYAKAHAPPAAASVGSDEEEDEDEEEEGDDGHSLSTQAREREVKDLEARLLEETQKLTGLFAAEQPNQSMIDVQQAVLNMVQKALLDAKHKFHEHKQKNAGKTKSKPKPAKAKASGAGASGRKSSSAAAAPKKATGGGGQKKKKHLSAADKDSIANAINDLEYPHLDKAIEIIKRDTGQMESEDGELELDIDQLSTEALLKLWEMCKRVLPGFGKDSAAAAAPPSPEVSKASSKQSKSAAPKSKKNKPMSAQEQEARIAKLREISGLFQDGQEPPADAPEAAQHDLPMMNDSSDDSSEEE